MFGEDPRRLRKKPWVQCFRSVAVESGSEEAGREEVKRTGARADKCRERGFESGPRLASTPWGSQADRMELGNKNRRKVLVVNENMQRRIILAVALLPTIGLTTAAVIVAVFCRRLLGEASQAEADLPSLVPLFLSVLGFVVVCGVVVLHQALRFSHKIAGPVYRITRSMERIREGDVGFRVNLRRGDYLTEIADELNLLLDWLNENPPPGVRTGSDVVEVARAQNLDPDAVDGLRVEEHRAAESSQVR